MLEILWLQAGRNEVCTTDHIKPWKQFRDKIYGGMRKVLQYQKHMSALLLWAMLSYPGHSPGRAWEPLWVMSGELAPCTFKINLSHRPIEGHNRHYEPGLPSVVHFLLIRRGAKPRDNLQLIELPVNYVIPSGCESHHCPFNEALS